MRVTDDMVVEVIKPNYMTPKLNGRNPYHFYNTGWTVAAIKKASKGHVVDDDFAWDASAGKKAERHRAGGPVIRLHPPGWKPTS